ncbi:MAG: type III-A CRISPR-associated RAMP protein Csm5 [SAR324 cluster bacterium]|nr:type III-A CRISPR-associated RAMP protein Csm5 [SAR324 cluster bacterium]
MSEKQKSQHWLVTLTTLCPVHIGSGNSLKQNLDYFTKDSKTIILNRDKLEEKVAENAKFTEYAQAIADNNVSGFLPAIGGEKAVLKENLPFETNSDLKLFMRNGFNIPYIPGSSLKGAIRTLFAKYYALKIEPQIDWTQYRENKKNNIFMNANKLEDSLFGHIQSDWMRTIMVADSMLQESDLEWNPVKVFSKTHNENLQPKHWFMGIETTKSQITTQFQFGFNAPLLERLQGNQPLKTAVRDNLLNVLKTASIQRIKEEKEFAEKYKQQKIAQFYENLEKMSLTDLEFLMPMSWGTGWRGVTGNLLPENFIKDLRNQGWKIGKIDKGNVVHPFPKSQRWVVQGKNDAVSPLGWVKLSFQSMENYKEEKLKAYELQIEQERLDQEEQQRLLDEEEQLASMSDVDRLIVNMKNDPKFDYMKEYPKLETAGEDQRKLAEAFKEVFQRDNNWEDDKPSKKQLVKIARIKEILGES